MLAQPAAPRCRLRDPQMSARTKSAGEKPVPFIDGLVYGEVDLARSAGSDARQPVLAAGAPTKDPAVLEAREEEKKRRNEEYGRVLSGDANEEQVNAYYDYREKLSTDYPGVRRVDAQSLRGQDIGRVPRPARLVRQAAQGPSRRDPP